MVEELGIGRLRFFNKNQLSCMKTNKFHSVILLGALLFLVLTLFSKTSLHIKVAEATAPNPYWWVDNSTPPNFSQYDTYQFKNGRWHNPGTGLQFYSGSGTDSAIISTNASYDGVAAIGPTGTIGDTIETFFTSDTSASDELEWQCVELVKRFLFMEYGTRSQPANGYQVVDTYANTFPTMYKKVTNDSTNTTNQIYPKPGDILSYIQQPIPSTSPVQYDNGHTALVKSVTNQSGGSATVQLIEQNASSTGITNQTFSNWQFQNGIDDSASDGHTVSGWLTTTAAHLTWTNQNSMNNAHAAQESVLLPDGKVLVVGGTNATSVSIKDTQLFTDGTPGTWATKANMNADRKFFIMQNVTVSGGGNKVLAAGGVADSPCSCVRNTAELYNESANTWTSTATNMNAARWNQASSILSDGRVLVTGGDSSGSQNSTLSSTEIYDPVADTWTTKHSMAGAREGHMQVTFTDSSGNSKVMVIGGWRSGGTGALKTTEIYDPSTDTWSAGQNLAYTHSWTSGRSTTDAIVLYDGRILIMGGDSTGGMNTEVYNPATNTWSTYVLPSPAFAWGSAAVRLGAGAGYKVLLAGNVANSGTYGKQALIFNPENNTWATTTSMNSYHGVFTLVKLSNDNVIAAGGQSNTANASTATEKFTP